MCVARIDCVNMRPYPVPAHREMFELRMLIGDGCALNCADREYDITYSNSVIEHLGSWERQLAFASEIRRVGGRLWVQTPARECPIEPHFLALFVHWLPVNLRKFVVQYASIWGWTTKANHQQASEMVNEIRLLSRREFGACFPDCIIITERMFGVIPKSYIAVRGGDALTTSEIT